MVIHRMSLPHRFRIHKSAIYWWVALIFFSIVPTGIGKYFTQFSVIYPAFLVGMLGFVCVLDRGRVVLCFCASWLCWAGLLLFSLFVVMSVLDPGSGTMPQITGVLVYLLAYVLSALLGTKNEYFPTALLPALVISAGTNIYEFFVAQDSFSISPGRAAGFHVNPNVSGMMLVGLWILWLALRPNKASFHAIVISALVFLGMLITFSRSAIIEYLLLGVLAVGMMRARAGNGTLRTVIVLLCIAALFGVGFAWLDSQALSGGAAVRVESLRGGNFDDDSSVGRMDAALYYWNVFVASPLVGAGKVISLGGLDGGVGPHNAFIGLAADFGILPILLLFGILAGVIRIVFRNRFRGPYDALLSVGVVWIFLSGVSSHNVLYDLDAKLMLGIIIGFLGCYRCASRQRRAYVKVGMACSL